MSRSRSNIRFAIRRIPRFILYVLNRIGISIDVFLTMREYNLPPAKAGSEGRFAMAFLDDSCIDQIQEVEPVSSRAEIARWLGEGKLCFGVRDGPVLVAKMWCDLEALHYAPAYRRLEGDEAYLYAAAVRKEYRGSDMASRMRMECCARLREMGRTRFVSYTDYFNYPARRFKEKLGSEAEMLGLYVVLFGRWSFSRVLKRYD